MKTDRAGRLLNRGRPSSIVTNSLLILSAQGVTAIFGAIFWVLAARNSDPATTGLAGTFVSAVGATSLASTTGLVVGSIPLLARSSNLHRRRSDAVSAGAATAIFSLAGGITLIAVVPTAIPGLAAAHDADLAAAIVISVVATGVGQYMDTVSLATGRAQFALMRGGLAGSARLLVFALPGSLTLSQLLWSYAVATVAADAIALKLLWPAGAPWRLPGAISLMWEKRGYFAAHHVTSLSAAGVSLVLPVIVLSQLGQVAAGFFYPVWLLCGMFFMVSPAVAAAHMARRQREGSLRDQLRQSAALITALLALPLVVACAVPSRLLAVLGPGYPEQGRWLLIALAVSAIPGAALNMAVAVLRVQGRLKTAAVINAVVSAFALAAAIPLLAGLGIAGAGATWLLSQTVGGLLAIPVLHQAIRSQG